MNYNLIRWSYNFTRSTDMIARNVVVRRKWSSQWAVELTACKTKITRRWINRPGEAFGSRRLGRQTPNHLTSLALFRQRQVDATTGSAGTNRRSHKLGLRSHLTWPRRNGDEGTRKTGAQGLARPCNEQGLTFRWNFAEISVFFSVSASYREMKFRYISPFFVFKFKNSKIFIKKSKKIW